MGGTVNLRALLALVVQSSLHPLATGCERSGKSESGFARIGYADPPHGLEELRAAIDADWISVTALNTDGATADEGDTETWEVGTACAGARDVPACRRTIDELARTARDDAKGWDPSRRRFLVNKGDEVRQVEGETALLELFGRIETEAEVYFLAVARGYRFPAEWPPTRATMRIPWIRTTSDGFELIGNLQSEDAHEERRVSVHRDGTFTVLEKLETPAPRESLWAP